MCRSAAVLTVVVSVADSSPGFGSVVVEVTLAVFERLASRAGSTCTTRCTVAEVRPRSPRFQLTVPAVLVPPLSAETKLVPAGTASEIETLRAKEGPLLVTVSVKVVLGQGRDVGGLW